MQGLTLSEDFVEQADTFGKGPGGEVNRLYHIIFQNGIKIQGEACNFLEIDGNLTIFAHNEKGGIHRVFVPGDNIKESSRGQKLGEVLKAQHNVPEEAVNTGLDKQARLRGKTLGNYFLEKGFVTEGQLQSALSRQAQASEYKVRIGEFLIAEGLINQDQLDSAIELQRQDRSKKLGDILVASTVLGVIAQRLIRTLCSHCKREEEVDATVRRILKIEANERFETGTGCQHCHQTGYSGKLPVYELLVLDETIKQTILDDGSEVEIKRAAVAGGMQTITGNALNRARAGETSIAEVHKIYST
jgi:hypothetical protein